MRRIGAKIFVTVAAVCSGSKKVSRELGDFREALENLKSKLILSSPADTGRLMELCPFDEIFIEAKKASTKKKARLRKENIKTTGIATWKRERSAEKYFVLCVCSDRLIALAAPSAGQ